MVGLIFCVIVFGGPWAAAGTPPRSPRPPLSTPYLVKVSPAPFRAKRLFERDLDGRHVVARPRGGEHGVAEAQHEHHQQQQVEEEEEDE